MADGDELLLEGGDEVVVVLLVDVEHQRSGVQVDPVLRLRNLEKAKLTRQFQRVMQSEVHI
jgi:hypothetical protein